MKISIRNANKGDHLILSRLDPHLNEMMQMEKIERSEVLICESNDEIIGVVRYSLFWDQIPFVNWIWVDPDRRRGSIGRRLIHEIALVARRLDRGIILASTQADEEAQHFYRRIGFKDIGGFVLENEPLEIVMSLDINNL